MSKPRSNRRHIDGVLLIDKPYDISSNNALQKARWLLNAAKAGHTGVLDPLATGLLPVCLGKPPSSPRICWTRTRGTAPRSGSA